MELYAADAIFLTGSGAGIVPVGAVDGRPVATSDHPYPATLTTCVPRANPGRALPRSGSRCVASPPLRPHERAHGGGDLGRARQRRELEILLVRHRVRRGADPRDGRIEVPEAVLCDVGSDLRAVAAELDCLVDDDDAVRLRDRRRDRVGVERDERAWVYDLDVDALAPRARARPGWRAGPSRRAPRS